MNNEDVNIYNKIDKYNEISDELLNEINSNQEITQEEKEKYLYPMVEDIKNDTEILTVDYINWLKDKTNEEKKLNINKKLEAIIEKIDIFRNQVYDICLKHKEE